MKRCVTACRECKIVEPPYPKDSFVVDIPDVRYKWCVYRHEEPLRRGEYNIEVKDNGNITGTVCYRSKIVPRTVVRSRKHRGGM